jgi:hypothetical protein
VHARKIERKYDAWLNSALVKCLKQGRCYHISVDFPIKNESILLVHRLTGILWAIASLVYRVTVCKRNWTNYSRGACHCMYTCM